MPRVLRAAFRASIGVVIMLVIACGDQSPTRPLLESSLSGAQGPATQAALEAQINGLINALYAPTEQGDVARQFARIKAQIASGRTTDAQTSIVTFVQTVLGDLAGGDLEDPNGAQPPSTADALALLVNAVAQFGGLPAPIPPSNPLGSDGAVAVVGPAGGTVVTSSGFGGVQFPAGALPANTIVVVERLPNPATPNAGPLPTTFNQYPLFYDFSTTPHVAQFAQPVLVGICQLEVGQPFGPPTQTVADRLQIAHPNPSNPATLELLVREPAPFVDCAGASLAQARQRRQGEGLLARALGTIRDVGTRAVSVFRPTPAYAVHGGLGGKTTSFSPFGAVDPGPAACTSAPTGFATVSCFSFTTIPGVTHGFFVGSSITLVPSIGVLSADYALLSPTGFTKLPPNTPMDVNQAQYLFQAELNETTGVWSDVLRIVSPANQPAQQITINVVKPMIVGVCATPMSGVAQTYATMDVALVNVAPGGTIKVCPQTIAVPGTVSAPPFQAGVTIGYTIRKPVTIEAETASNKPQFILNGSNVNIGFALGTAGRVTFRNLSFTLSNSAVGSIDIGGNGMPWNDVLVENNVFNLQPGIGRAVRVFSSSVPNPKITIQGNQMSGGTFPVVTLTGSPTGTIEVLNNSFTGSVGNAGAQIQNEASVRVEGNTFSGGGCGGHGCVFLLNVSNAMVRNNTMVLPDQVFAPAIKFSSSNGTITQNSITAVGGGGPASDENSYATFAGILISPQLVTDLAGITSSTVSVTRNTVSNAVAGVRVIGGGIAVTGSDNVFSNVHSALRLDNTSATPSSLVMSGSDFTSYFSPITFAGAGISPNTVLATCNWWGSAAGPQNLLAGTPSTAYTPWATGPVANGAGGACPPAPTFTISASPTSLPIAAGANSTSTVTIARTNFTTDVALSLVGLPAGFTGTFTPTTLSGTTLTSSLQLNVGGAVAPGTYPITVQGVGGSITQTTPISVTVTAPSAIVYEFCNNDDPPLKFWRQSGGTWAEVSPTAGTGVTRFSFTISGSTGGIAYTRAVTAANVQNALRTSKPRTSFGELLNRQPRQKAADARARLTNQTAALTSPYFNTFVMFALTTEIESNRAICATPTLPTPVSKTFNVSGMAANETGILGYGNATASLTPAIANYNLMVTPGTYDWLAAFGIPGASPSLATNWTNYRLGRGETAAGGSVAINRTGAPAFVTMPFTIIGGNAGSLYANNQFLTGANGSILALPLSDAIATTNTGNLLFLAANDRLATDMNSLTANNFELVSNVTSMRGTIRYFGPNPPASATFALPQPVPAFTVTQVSGAPVTTWTVSGQIPTDYQTSTSPIEVLYTGAGESALCTHVATRGWLTANNMNTSYALTGPTLPGFLQQWAAAAPLFDATSAMLTNFTIVPTAGANVSFSLRQVQNP